MTIDEAARLPLDERIRNARGDEVASTLMAGLTWGDEQLATREDLVVLRGELKVDIAELRGDVKAVAGEVIRTLFFGIVATNATVVGLVLAAVKLG